VNSLVASFGSSRERAASVSFVDIEMAARKLMAAGDYPSVHAVRVELKRGSTTTIADAMRRFWKDQSALNAGNPVALTRLPPEFADAAVRLWEQALRLSQQTAKIDGTAASARLEALKRDTDVRAHSIELREKEWDMAARVRERALVDTREQVNVLLKELANATAELRSQKAQITDLEARVEDYRQHLSTVIARAALRNRASTAPKHRAAKKSGKRKVPKKHKIPLPSKRSPRRR
jgi:hypothetical protein